MIHQPSKLTPKKPLTGCHDLPAGCPTPPKGLGDRVEQLAQPIAKAIDKVAGTNIQSCGGCQKRKEWLNTHFPSGK